MVFASRQKTSDLLLVLILFAVFAAGAMLLSAIGSNVYRNIAITMQENYNLRTGVLYVAEKTRQNDVSGSLRVDTVNGQDALVLIEQTTGKKYETWIFVYDNTLCEQLIAADSNVDLATVQRIMPMAEMKLEQHSNGILTVNMTMPEGTVTSIKLVLRSKETSTDSFKTQAASTTTDSRTQNSTYAISYAHAKNVSSATMVLETQNSASTLSSPHGASKNGSDAFLDIYSPQKLIVDAANGGI